MNTDFPTQNTTPSFVGFVEAELLIHCARTHPTPDDLARIQALLRMPLDWPHLLTIATQHHVLPQLYQTLQQLDADLVPTAVRQRLREYFQHNAIRNHYLLSELQRLLKLLEANHPGDPLQRAAVGEAILRPIRPAPHR